MVPPQIHFTEETVAQTADPLPEVAEPGSGPPAEAAGTKLKKTV